MPPPVKIYEDAGGSHNAAKDHHQLGIVAEEQQRFDEARAFYNKALEIYEDAGDSHKAANQYQGWGNIKKGLNINRVEAFLYKSLKYSALFTSTS